MIFEYIRCDHNNVIWNIVARVTGGTVFVLPNSIKRPYCVREGVAANV